MTTNNMNDTISGKKVKEWIDNELPPLSWSVISMRTFKVFMNAGISARTMDDSTVFTDAIIKEMNKVALELYKKEIPF